MKKNPKPLRCLIVDDEKLAREEMGILLGRYPDVEIVGEAGRVDKALELTALLKPDAVFLDIRLRSEDGFAFVHRVPEPRPHIVFVTAYDEYAVRAFEVHALDYLLKPVRPHRLEATRQRLLGYIAVSTRARDYAALLRTKVGDPARLEKLGLAAREAEVLFWIAYGKTNAEIAGLLGKSVETVKKQVQSIIAKLGAKTRVQAAIIAAEALRAQA